MLALPPLSLYVHIPWCVRKCPYCDFNSHVGPDNLPQQDYLNCLLADLATETTNIQGRKLSSIFFGGGTPSLMSPQFIGNFLSATEKLMGFEDDIEITLEANPGTTDEARFSGFHSAGVNRLSIGIQSFNNQQLQQLGRIHDRAAAVNAFSSARKAGFSNINIDLMHGLPQQSTQEALADLQMAFDLQPEHLSWYQLTLEPNTVFYKSPPTLPDEDMLADIQDAGEAALHENGYSQYEISAYSTPGRQSHHNLNYWRFGDYLGVGAGAHGKITHPENGTIVRTAKTRLPQDYLDRKDNWLATRSPIDSELLPLEFMMNALRLVNGVERDIFMQRTGLDFSLIEQRWRKLEQQGLVAGDSRRLSTTPTGLRFLNQVLETFMPASVKATPHVPSH
jgi:oxygen-independent coproporphyrinogen-3 oxidase